MTVTNECIPYQEPGDDLPCSVKAGKSVVGKRFVVIGEDMQGDPNGLSTDVEGNNYVIEPAPANALVVLGVASHNAAEKKKVTVKGAPCVLPVTAGAAIAAGEQVGVGAEGKAVKVVPRTEAEIKEGKSDFKTPPVGLALADAAEGVDCPVKLY
jgi:hypothetical protein